MAHSSNNQWQWQSGNDWGWTAADKWQWPKQEWKWSATGTCIGKGGSAQDHQQEWWQRAAATTPAVAGAAANDAAWTVAGAAANDAAWTPRVADNEQYPDCQQTPMPSDPPDNPPMPPDPPGNPPMPPDTALQRLDLNYFLNYQDFTDDYKQHNAALKYLREQQEDPVNPFGSPMLPLPLAGPLEVAVILHAEKAMNWEFSDSRRQWSWHEMIAQLTDDDIRLVVNGDQGRSGGLVACFLALRPGSYDHKRHHMLRENRQNGGVPRLPIWDFVVVREDGTAMRIRPQWSTRKVEVFEAGGHENAVAPPRNGLGRSDGPGTYKHFKALATRNPLRFDHTKRP